MSLSEDLSRLSVRAKETEDRVAAAKTEAREKLEQARSNARTDAQQTAEHLQAKSSAAADKVKSYGEGVGRSWKEHLATVRQGAEERKARHEAHKAEDDAERAEEYAALVDRFRVLGDPGGGVRVTRCRARPHGRRRGGSEHGRHLTQA